MIEFFSSFGVSDVIVGSCHSWNLYLQETLISKHFTESKTTQKSEKNGQQQTKPIPPPPYSWNKKMDNNNQKKKSENRLSI